MKYALLILFITVSWFSDSNFVLAQSISNQPEKSFRVVLDPGHGGRDSVTRMNGFYEKNIVLDIAKVIQSYLTKNDFDVIMTRETDVYISLPDRAAVRGDIFISLHANSVADTIGPSVRSMIKGIDVYTAKKMLVGDELLSKSKTLASSVAKQLSSVKGISIRGVRQKELAVLSANQSAAILVELGFLTNEEDLAFLTNPENYPQLAEAFVRAIRAYQRL